MNPPSRNLLHDCLFTAQRKRRKKIEATEEDDGAWEFIERDGRAVGYWLLGDGVVMLAEMEVELPNEITALHKLNFIGFLLISYNYAQLHELSFCVHKDLRNGLELFMALFSILVANNAIRRSGNHQRIPTL